VPQSNVVPLRSCGSHLATDLLHSTLLFSPSGTLQHVTTSCLLSQRSRRHRSLLHQSQASRRLLRLLVSFLLCTSLLPYAIATLRLLLDSERYSAQVAASNNIFIHPPAYRYRCISTITTATRTPPFHSRYQTSHMSDLKQRLARLGLSQYVDVLTAEGFDTWETILDITESDL
jgi:hypothetical protein